MGATDNREKLIADSQFGAGAITIGAVTYAPANWFIGLSTTTPNDDGSNFIEPSTGGYARVSKANDATNWPPAQVVSGECRKSNGTKITFPNPSANWGEITHYGLFTATGVNTGTPEYTNPLDTPITIRSGNTPVEFDIGNLVLIWS